MEGSKLNKKALLLLSLVVWGSIAAIFWGIRVSFANDCQLHHPPGPLLQDCVSRSGWLVFGLATFLFFAEAVRTFLAWKAISND